MQKEEEEEEEKILPQEQGLLCAIRRIDKSEDEVWEEFVACLKQEGPNPVTCDGIPALHFACFLKKVRMVRALWEHPDLDPLARTKYAQPETAFEYACRGGSIAVVDILLHPRPVDGFAFGGEEEPSSCPNHSPALLLAARYGHELLVDYLVTEKKHSLTYADAQGRTALHWACMQDDRKMVRLLVRHGALWNVVDKEYGNTPVHTLVLYNRLSFLSALLRRTSVYNQKQSSSLTQALWMRNLQHERPLDMAQAKSFGVSFWWKIFSAVSVIFTSKESQAKNHDGLPSFLVAHFWNVLFGVLSVWWLVWSCIWTWSYTSAWMVLLVCNVGLWAWVVCSNPGMYSSHSTHPLFQHMHQTYLAHRTRWSQESLPSSRAWYICSVCQLAQAWTEDAPFVHHSGDACCLEFDHHCMWVHNKIGAWNEARFMWLVTCLSLQACWIAWQMARTGHFLWMLVWLVALGGGWFFLDLVTQRTWIVLCIGVLAASMAVSPRAVLFFYDLHFLAFACLVWSVWLDMWWTRWLGITKKQLLSQYDAVPSGGSWNHLGRAVRRWCFLD